jgi:hypothetical protein
VGFIEGRAGLALNVSQLIENRKLPPWVDAMSVVQMAGSQIPSDIAAFSARCGA